MDHSALLAASDSFLANSLEQADELVTLFGGRIESAVDNNGVEDWFVVGGEIGQYTETDEILEHEIETRHARQFCWICGEPRTKTIPISELGYGAALLYLNKWDSNNVSLCDSPACLADTRELSRAERERLDRDAVLERELGLY